MVMIFYSKKQILQHCFENNNEAAGEITTASFHNHPINTQTEAGIKRRLVGDLFLEH